MTRLVTPLGFRSAAYAFKNQRHKRVIPPYRSSLLEGVGFGLHAEDYAFPLEDLVTPVKAQAAATP